MSNPQESQGQRLKEERERLGLSQAKFAESCGVGKTAQYTYEAGERSPDARYLQEAGRLGVDVWFVLLGRRTTEPDMESLAKGVVLHHISRQLGLDPEELADVLATAARKEKLAAQWQEDDDPTEVHRRAAALVDRALSQRDETAAKALELVVTATEKKLASLGVAITPEKKSKLIAMLFRTFQRTEEVNETVVSEAVSLIVD